MNIKLNKKNGFTLLEVLISISILAVIGVIGFTYLANYRRSSQLNLEAGRIVGYFRQTQNNAIAGKNLSDWGIHFSNPSGDGGDFFVIFEGSSFGSSTTTERIYLNKGVGFSIPADDSSIDVIFQRNSGRTSSSTISIISKVNINLSKQIQINSLGQIISSE